VTTEKVNLLVALAFSMLSGIGGALTVYGSYRADMSNIQAELRFRAKIDERHDKEIAKFNDSIDAAVDKINNAAVSVASLYGRLGLIPEQSPSGIDKNSGSK